MPGHGAETDTGRTVGGRQLAWAAPVVSQAEGQTATPDPAPAGPDTIVLDAVEVSALTDLLRSSNSDRAGTLRVLDLLDALVSRGEVNVRYEKEARLLRGSVFQPYNLTPGQTVFPVAYPYGFGECPLSLILARSQWRYLILKGGARTLSDLHKLPIGDIPWPDKSLESTVIASRRKADEIISSGSLPPGGYEPIPGGLTDVRAKELLRRVSLYLGPRRREIFERAFGFYGQAQTLPEVAHSMGLGQMTPYDNIRAVFDELGTSYDWRPAYLALRSDPARYEVWMTGLSESARELLPMLERCRGYSPGRYLPVEKAFGADPGTWPEVFDCTPHQRLKKIQTDERKARQELSMARYKASIQKPAAGPRQGTH